MDIEIVNVFLRCMSQDLLGRNVMLSNGSVGKIVFINPHNFEYPIVEVNNEILMTNPDVYTVCLNPV